MIKEIRQYIKESIACVDPQMKMDKQPLTISTIPTTAIESTYTVRFGLTTLSRDDSDINGLFRVSVDIFKKLGTSPNDTYDNAYLKALLIYSTISDQERINQDDYIKAISDVLFDRLRTHRLKHAEHFGVKIAYPCQLIFGKMIAFNYFFPEFHYQCHF